MPNMVFKSLRALGEESLASQTHRQCAAPGYSFFFLLLALVYSTSTRGLFFVVVELTNVSGALPHAFAYVLNYLAAALCPHLACQQKRDNGQSLQSLFLAEPYYWLVVSSRYDNLLTLQAGALALLAGYGLGQSLEHIHLLAFAQVQTPFLRRRLSSVRPLVTTMIGLLRKLRKNSNTIIVRGNITHTLLQVTIH